MRFTYIDLFAGIGGFHQAADSLGGACVFASETDSAARAAYERNYNMSPRGDITKINAYDIPDHDVLFAGFPCQPFSIIGKRQGFDDQKSGGLFFEIVRVLDAKKPKMFILENVKQLKGHKNGETISIILSELKRLGYVVYCDVLNALNFGLPQKRERTIIVGFKEGGAGFSFPNPRLRGRLEDFLEPEHTIDRKYFADSRIVEKRMKMHKSEFSPGIWHENKSGNVSSYPYSCALRAGASHNYLLVDGRRRLTPREMLRLQGFPDDFVIVCSDFQTRKQAGNAVPVNVIRETLKTALNYTTTRRRCYDED